MPQARWLSPLVVLALTAAVNSSCGAGQVGQAVRPVDATAWEATGDTGGECKIVSDRGEPLIVDWPAHQRGNLEEAMNDGIAVVAYDCHSLRLLKGCQIDATYGFMAFSKKEEDIRFDNADDVAANLPAFGVPLVQGLKGELTRDSTLDLATVLIGKRRTTLRGARLENLVGGTACDGATHFVRGAFVGAFAMGTGTKGAANIGAGLFSAGSTSAKLSNYRDGDPGACQQVTADASAAPAACNALVRLELVALGAPTGKEETEAPTCANGLVFAQGKCVHPSADIPHQCVRGDVADCTAQCAKRDAGSCTTLGSMYDLGMGVQRDDAKFADLMKQACDEGSMEGCFWVGFRFRFTMGPNRERAVALFTKGCDAGNANCCFGLAGTYEDKDAVKAVLLYKRACAGGSGFGCESLASAYLLGKGGLAKDEVRGHALMKQACDGGALDACALLAQGERDPVRKVGFFKQRCDFGDAHSCAEVAKAYNGVLLGFPVDAAMALKYWERACPGDTQACGAAGQRYESGQGVPVDRNTALHLYELGCHAEQSDPPSCDGLKRLGGGP